MVLLHRGLCLGEFGNTKEPPNYLTSGDVQVIEAFSSLMNKLSNAARENIIHELFSQWSQDILPTKDGISYPFHNPEKQYVSMHEVQNQPNDCPNGDSSSSQTIKIPIDQNGMDETVDCPAIAGIICELVDDKDSEIHANIVSAVPGNELDENRNVRSDTSLVEFDNSTNKAICHNLVNHSAIPNMNLIDSMDLTAYLTYQGQEHKSASTLQRSEYEMDGVVLYSNHESGNDNVQFEEKNRRISQFKNSATGKVEMDQLNESTHGANQVIISIPLKEISRPGQSFNPKDSITDSKAFQVFDSSKTINSSQMLEYHRSQDIKQRGWEPKVKSPDGDTEEHVDVPQALEYYDVHNNGRRGYVIRPIEPGVHPWKELRQLQSVVHRDQYEVGDIVYIYFGDGFDDGIALIRDIRDLGDGRAVICILWYATVEESIAYKCKNPESWPPGKTHMLTNQLAVLMWDTTNGKVTENSHESLCHDKILDVCAYRCRIYNRNHRSFSWIKSPAY